MTRLESKEDLIDELYDSLSMHISEEYCEKLIRNLTVIKRYVKAKGLLGRVGKYYMTSKT